MSIPAYFICAFIGIIVLLWTKFMTVDECGDPVLPIGYVILIAALCFVPFLNIFMAIGLPVGYICFRFGDGLYLKDNKFNNFFFKK